MEKLAKFTIEKQHFPEDSQVCCQGSDKICWEITKFSKRVHKFVWKKHVYSET